MSVTTAQRRILIVEDDADIRGLLSLRLRQRSYDTSVATDGMTALAVARREQPDLIVLDLGLPAGDGFTVMQRIRAITSLADVPVVVITARDATTNRQKAEAFGAVAFVEKPIDFDQLLETIGALLVP
jgi:two-component system OmpR family response regulator